MIAASIGFAVSMLATYDNGGISMNSDGIQAVSNLSSDENQEIVNSGDLNFDFEVAVVRVDYNIDGTIKTVNGIFWTPGRLDIDVKVTELKYMENYFGIINYLDTISRFAKSCGR